MNKKMIRFMTEIGIFSALGLVLDYLAGLYSPAIWPAGGSISIAMVPIFLMACRWGLKGGLTTGLVVGAVQILWASGSALVHPLQIILDYPLSYGVLGLIGMISSSLTQENNSNVWLKLTVMMSLVGIARTIFHIVSGVLYFGAPWVVSIGYNMGYMMPSLVLSIVLMLLLLKKAKHLVLPIE